ncbi:hypothetical protein [Streptomyces sp. NPDC058279]|uniref:hypothetical protein n=1 Tax=Streptomyces sp. NPDC058279 TaxID=3346418 RepID=UPI0036F129FB
MRTLREAADGADHVTLRYAARALGLPWTRIPTLRATLAPTTLAPTAGAPSTPLLRLG